MNWDDGMILRMWKSRRKRRRRRKMGAAQVEMELRTSLPSPACPESVSDKT
jgi:hypothetical protein